MSNTEQGSEIMKKVHSIYFIVSLIFMFSTMSAFAATHAESIQCTECGMTVDLNSKFSARIVTGKTTSYFCDIGDLFSYLKRTGMTSAGAEVKDYSTGEWLSAGKAFYVHDDTKFKSPMGWGIAAFNEKTRAASAGAVLDFDSTAKSLK